VNHPVYELLKRLDKQKIHYTLSRHREDTIMINISLVGERIEAEVFDDGHMEVVRFLGTEDILGGQELIYSIIEKNSFENKAWEKFTDNKKTK
jgi:hypothetical protein